MRFVVEEKNEESSKRLLDEIEGDWDSPAPGSVTEKKRNAELDAAARRLVESLDPPPVSVETLDELDAGWGDDEDEEEEPEEPEPELPDEAADPIAYAIAKKARDERVEARRQRRRAKAEAKKARRKARVDAQKQKQKGKSKKVRAAKPAPSPTKAAKRAGRAAASPALTDDADSSSDDALEDDEAAKPAPSRARAKLPLSKPMRSKPMLSKTNAWMLGIVVVIFLAAAIFAAVVGR